MDSLCSHCLPGFVFDPCFVMQYFVSFFSYAPSRSLMKNELIVVL